MASPEEKLGVPVQEDGGSINYPEPAVGGEIVEPLVNYDLDYSGGDSHFTTSKHLKEQAEGVIKENKEGNSKEENRKGLDNLKSTFIATGVFIAIIGVIFALAKKIKEA